MLQRNSLTKCLPDKTSQKYGLTKCLPDRTSKVIYWDVSPLGMLRKMLKIKTNYLKMNSKEMYKNEDYIIKTHQNIDLIHMSHFKGTWSPKADRQSSGALRLFRGFSPVRKHILVAWADFHIDMDNGNAIKIGYFRVENLWFQQTLKLTKWPIHGSIDCEGFNPLPPS